MSVKTPTQKLAGEMPEKKCCSLTNCGCNVMVKKLFITLFGILLVYAIVLLGTIIRNNMSEYNYIGQADKMERTISIEGEGRVTATPDIAVTTMGMISEGATVAEAQEKNTLTMNNLTDKLKKLEISEDDLQTINYNIYPNYDYTEKDGRVLKGYEVQQSLKVKIRNLEIANQVLALAGEVGVNSVSGLEFTIDEEDVYLAQAREEALQKVAEKARVLSQSLGVQLIKVVSYNEYQSGGNGMPYYKDYYADAVYGLGGGAPSPDVQAGSSEIVMNVAVTFEIR